MDYTLGKWLEKVERKLNAVLELHGIDPETLTPLEPADQTPQAPEETPQEPQETPQEPQEVIDTEEPKTASKEEMHAKAEAINKSMKKTNRLDVSGNPIRGEQ